MTTLETVTTIEHRCEALTISDIPPYRCTTSATAERRGRAVCASHARDLHIRWFDDAADLSLILEKRVGKPARAF